MHEKFSALASTAASQKGVLTFEQLRQGGLSPDQIKHRVRRGELVRRKGRVFVIAGSEATWRREASAAALAVAGHLRVEGGPIGVVSHRSAARLLGFRTVDTDIDVSIRYPRRLSLAGVKVVRSCDLELEDTTWVDGIPTTTPERTIVDLGLVFPESEVMRILRHAVATGQVNRRDVVRMRLRTSKQGRNGTGVTGRCLEALPELAEETESGLEALFLELCEQCDLPPPVLQLPVVANGRRYRLDFAYPEQKVFIEIDGAWHGEYSQIGKDGGRQNDLVVHGWRPVRLRYELLAKSPDYCAELVRQALARPKDF